MTKIMEMVKEQKVYRVTSEHKTYYVVADNRGVVRVFYDEKCMSPAGLWLWQEKEIKSQLEKIVSFA